MYHVQKISSFDANGSRANSQTFRLSSHFLFGPLGEMLPMPLAHNKRPVREARHSLEPLRTDCSCFFAFAPYRRHNSGGAAAGKHQFPPHQLQKETCVCVCVCGRCYIVQSNITARFTCARTIETLIRQLLSHLSAHFS